MKDDSLEDAIKIGRENPVSEVLYGLKEKGKIPFISVEVKDGKVERAILYMSGIKYHFHPTEYKGEHIDEVVEDCPNEDCTGKFFSIPFDGWSISAVDEDNPFNKLK